MIWKPCRVALGEGQGKENKPGRVLQCSCKRGGPWHVFRLDDHAGWFVQCDGCSHVGVLIESELTADQVATILEREGQ